MTEGMRTLDPRHLTLLRIRTAIAAAVFFAAAAILDAAALRDTPLPFGALAGAVAALGLAAFMLLPERRYRAWTFRMDADELRIASGLMVRRDVIVPFGRVQHIDILRGPLQRRFGLASLVLHTAGTRSAAVLLPGLAHEEAERMRDHVRARIREDLV